MFYAERRSSNMLQTAARIAIGYLVLLVVFSVLFCNERMLFSDAPHVLFRIINQQQFQIAEHRYGSFITQLFPWLGAKAGIPLAVLMLIYSISFTFFPLVVSVLTYRARRYQLVVLMGLYFSLFVSDTFFWTNNEVHQGVTWLFLAFGCFWPDSVTNIKGCVALLLFVLVTALAMWTHPLVMFPALFLWFFFLLNGELQLPNVLKGVISILLLGLAYGKFYQGAHHGYDSGKIELVTQLNKETLTSLLSAPQVKEFVKGCLKNYWLFAIITAVGWYGLIKRKQYQMLVYCIGAVTGYLLLVFITYRDVTGLRFYMESEYMPLTILAATPFVYYIAREVSLRNLALLLAGVFVVRSGYILSSRILFTQRIVMLERMYTELRAQKIHKVIVKQDKATDDVLLMNWGAPVESMFISALHKDEPQYTFIISDDEQLKNFYTSSRDTMLGCFHKVAAHQLNKRYFAMDTTTVYAMYQIDDKGNLRRRDE